MDKQQLIDAINNAIGEDNYDEAFHLSQVLEQKYPGYGCFYLGMCHTMDWGVDGDPAEAIEYFTTSIDKGIEVASSWYFGSMAFFNCEEYEDAAHWAINAYNAGEKDGALMAGNCYVCMDRYAEAKKWLKLATNSGDPSAYSAMANCCSLNNESDEAMKWYLKAAEAGDDDAYLAAGMHYMSEGDYETAVNWLLKADQAGVSGAKSRLAMCSYKYATDLRNYAATQLNMSEYTQANAAAIAQYLNCQYLYYQAIQDAQERESMIIEDYVVLGRATSMLYNLACRGELSVDMVTDNSMMSYFTNSFKMVSGAMNDAAHEKWWNNAMNACALMDLGGFPIVGEFFRAECCLTNSQLHHSAEAYCRARWHLKRVGEMRSERGRYDVDDLVSLFQSVSDIEDNAEKMGKKYGASMQSMLAAGNLPDLTPDYLPGKAPDPRSCKSFMKMAGNSTRSATAGSAESPIKKLLGLFGKKG